MKINKGDTFLVRGVTRIAERIENGGVIELDPSVNAHLIVSENIINTGVIRMKPNPGVIHELSWEGVNNNEYVGGSMNPYECPKDKGLWNMATGVMDIKSETKNPYSFVVGGTKKGDVRIMVADPGNWKKGDEVVVCPTEKPEENSRYIDNGKYVDTYLPQMERRTINSIDGMWLTLNKPLEFDHNVVTTEPNDLASAGRVFFPYVINHTRNVKIHGEAPGKHAHIFSCAHEYDAAGKVVAHYKQLHSVDGAEVYWMGVRKWQPGGEGARKGVNEVVLGRYVMHFHHAGDGTEGSVIQNCSFHDNGGRCFVPHMANGITLKKSSITFNLGDGCWWDFQEMSHNIRYDGNILAGILWDGVQQGGTAMLLGIGDNCDCVNNIFIYANQGDPDGAGAQQWTTDNEGVWKTDNNTFIACKTGMWPWQNSGRAHDVTRAVCLNCWFAVTHGAYGNSYRYAYNEFYNSPVKHRASGSIYGGSSFHACVLDAMNKAKNCTIIMSSAVPGPVQYRQCQFKNASVAIAFDTYPHNQSDATWKSVEAINCKWDNIGTKLKYFNWSLDTGAAFQFQQGVGKNLFAKIQQGGTAVQIVPVLNGRTISQVETPTAKFAPDKYGTGDGLRFQIYKGLNFETLLLDHVRSLAREQDWRIELPKFPGGPHYKLINATKDGVVPFSARYTGQIEPYYTAPHRFRINGGSGFRLWIDDKLVIDAPENKHDNAEFKDSGFINLTAYKKVNIKLEVYEPADRNMGVLLSWEAQNIFPMRDPETSQLYSGVKVPPIVVPPVVIPPIENNQKTIVKTVITYADGTTKTY